MPSEEVALAKCPYCLAEIPVEAKKCFHCGEWINQSIKLSNPFCYWYSKIAILINILTLGAFIVWQNSKESIDHGQMLPIYIGIYLSIIFTYGFWRYSSTNDEWPFAFSAILSSIFSIIGILLLGGHLFDGVWSLIVVFILVGRSAVELYAAKRANQRIFL